MKKIKTRNLTKQILCIIIVLMLCNFIIPNYTFAVDTAKGGSLMEVIAQFLCFIPDAVINILQEMFIKPENIAVGGDAYSIKYSPGVIFSGQVPAFDINFINPNTQGRTSGNYGAYIKNNIESYYKERNNDSTGYENAKNRKDTSSISGKVELSDQDRASYRVLYWVENDILHIECYFDYGWVLFGTNEYYYSTTCSIKDSSVQEALANTSYDSIASELQPTIATWYKALRRIALVGLLSALVYIGIRILFTSTSAKDKAKYKRMLKDWLVALCILFTLHYIMSITITVIYKINEVITVSSIGANGEDILMTSLRNKILNGENWSSVLTYVVIYFVLTIYTIIYTIQYIRRVIYMAFLTMIAPLITLTYPLDKIKDSKAQAFDMWIKDYVFFALIQVVHLLIYYVFLGSAIDLASEGNWLFALVAIGFVSPAEKLIKKMFGFEKSKTLGALGAGATGALIMNAIQKIPQGSSTQGGASGKNGNTETGTTKGVRTAAVNPFADISEDGSENSPIRMNSSIGATSNGTVGATNNGAGNGNVGGANANSSQTGSEKESKLAKALKNKKLINSEAQTSFKLKVKRNLKGVKAVAGRYIPPVVGGTIRLMVGATGALAGFAAGIANGDVEKAISGLAIGTAAGNGVVNMVETSIRKVKDVPEKINDVVDTYREGAYGKEIAQNAKFDRAFRNSKEYEELKEASGFTDAEFNRKVQKMLNAGITDTKRMKKILKNHRLDPKRYTMDKSIQYSKLAEKCSEDILYDQVKFIRFCEDRNLGLTEEELVTLRKDIMNFK